MARVTSMPAFPIWRVMLAFFVGLQLVFLHETASAALRPRILLLLSGDDPAYAVVASTLESTLQRSAGRAMPFEITRSRLRSSDEDAQAELRGLNGQQYDVIVPIGTDASRMVRAQHTDTPVLNIFTTRESFEAIWEGAGAAGSSGAVSALYLEQPIARQMQFIRITLPRHRQCGVLLGRRSFHLTAELKAAAAKNRLALRPVDISEEKKPIDSIKGLIANNNVILAVPDAETLTPNLAKWLLYMAYQREVPVIGFSRAMVDAGALGALYTTPEQIGRQAAEILLRAALDAANAKNPVWHLPPAQYPAYFEVTVNDAVARSLKLHVQSETYLAESLIRLEQSEIWRAEN